ncbi:MULTISPECIES: thermonuclease family protein [unclassified Bradyrhizobium]|uniref:thermonuclease family protein n=1 Tax=unclassified Bradyrhizobium TaxID=2631580 RepID=UPI002916064D|nr:MULTISPECIES: thermonuclease family protein [unclassified Bradyrhizobium]
MRLRALCVDSGGKNSRCGQTVANALSEHFEGKSVSRASRGTDQNRRTVAVCTAENIDLGDWLVRRGLAIDYVYYSKGRYRPAQV